MAAVAERGDLVIRRYRRVAHRRLIQSGVGWEAYAQNLTAAALVVAVFVYGVLLCLFAGDLPPTGFVLAAVLGGLFLSPRLLAVLYSCIVVWYCIAAWVVSDVTPRLFSGFVVLVLVMSVMALVSQSRGRLGVYGLSGEHLLLELRERLAGDAAMPDLPSGWIGEVSVRNAYGQGFSGDFVVSQLSPDGRTLEIVVADVSGKGASAGARALQLQGAVSGLIGPLPAEIFLTAANAYLVRQGWHEGFATAVHIAVDLETGRYSLGSAGHPPAVVHDAGTGSWTSADAARGPVLGILPMADFPRVEGRLERGDAIVLYTDGLVEMPGSDLSEGIDRMMGYAEQRVATGFRGLASALVERAGAGEGDDRAVVVLHRA